MIFTDQSTEAKQDVECGAFRNSCAIIATETETATATTSTTTSTSTTKASPFFHSKTASR